MARLKPKTGKIETLDDVDGALKEIGMLERELDQIDDDAQKKISEIKSLALKAGEKNRERVTFLSDQIGTYAEANKDDLFKDKRTIELSFGLFGYRKSTSIQVRKTTVELLKKLKLDAYIRIKEEPNKERMSDMDDELLAQVDAVRKVKDDFFCEATRGKNTLKTPA